MHRYICLECGVTQHRHFRDLPECPECGGEMERQDREGMFIPRKRSEQYETYKGTGPRKR